MKKVSIVFGLICFCCAVYGQPHDVVVVKDKQGGQTLTVDGTPFMINGMNWDYYPIGTNYEYNIWEQEDTVIIQALEGDMTLLQDMGANAIRVYTGIPPRWIEYICDNYGIYTMLNHSFGRYGLMVEGEWRAITDYSDQAVADILLTDVNELANRYKNTRGLLMYLLGNENNYGLFWQGAETEDFPDDEARKQAMGEERGRPMYRLMNDAAKLMHSIDTHHPIAICNGDNLFIDIIADECDEVDIYGTNVYRGSSFGDMFSEVKAKLDMPFMFTEFGSDAFNSISNQEDQLPQAKYVVANWKEIYAHSSNIKDGGNSLGGFTFQMSDGWWKFGQTEDLAKHDTNASWANGGYRFDYIKGKNNMNEEWFGICAKEEHDNELLYNLSPRAAYYALQSMHAFDPYKETSTRESLEAHTSLIDLERALHLALENEKVIIDK